jgi:hypothetical protein
MDSDTVDKLRRWVELDNKILRNKQEMATVVEEKKEVEDTILDYVETQNLENITVSITDGTIKFAKRTTTQALTLKTLRLLLDRFVEDEDKDTTTHDAASDKNQRDLLDRVYEFVSSHLTKKTTHVMSRSIGEAGGRSSKKKA